MSGRSVTRELRGLGLGTGEEALEATRSDTDFQYDLRGESIGSAPMGRSIHCVASCLGKARFIDSFPIVIESSGFLADELF